jgi:hypothetical protein
MKPTNWVMGSDQVRSGSACIASSVTVFSVFFLHDCALALLPEAHYLLGGLHGWDNNLCQ